LDLNARLRTDFREAHSSLPIRLAKPNDLRSRFDPGLRVRELDAKGYVCLAMEWGDGLQRHSILTQIKDNSPVVRANIEVRKGRHLLTRVKPPL